MSPSAPAAMPALATAPTYSDRPVECDGSRITGKCVRLFSTGMALISVVLRVAVSKVRIPRSHSITRGFPPARIYSDAINSSSIVADIPRLSKIGTRVSPIARSSEKFCILRAPIWSTSTYFVITSTCATDMTSATIGIPVTSRASARYSRPSSPNP